MKNDGGTHITNHRVVSHEEWLAARTAFLAKEKEFTRLQDQLNQKRRQLPWEPVRKEYVFEDRTENRRSRSFLMEEAN